MFNGFFILEDFGGVARTIIVVVRFHSPLVTPPPPPPSVRPSVIFQCAQHAEDSFARNFTHRFTNATVLFHRPLLYTRLMRRVK